MLTRPDTRSASSHGRAGHHPSPQTADTPARTTYITASPPPAGYAARSSPCVPVAVQRQRRGPPGERDRLLSLPAVGGRRIQLGIDAARSANSGHRPPWRVKVMAAHRLVARPSTGRLARERELRWRRRQRWTCCSGRRGEEACRTKRRSGGLGSRIFMSRTPLAHAFAAWERSSPPGCAHAGRTRDACRVAEVDHRIGVRIPVDQQERRRHVVRQCPEAAGAPAESGADHCGYGLICHC
jgi:hypothetical protein